jgi:two-component system OmpR family response regulator
LPEIDGIEVCKLIREKSNIPIIISSARGAIGDKTQCFELGADDYLPKPYDSQELVLRIHSLLRRNKIVEEKVQSTKKIFEINESKYEISKNNQPIELTNGEYNILKYCIKKAGYAVSREELLLNVESIKYESSYKSIDVLIGRIRSKIEKNPKQPQYIVSIRGIGYKFINE